MNKESIRKYFRDNLKNVRLAVRITDDKEIEVRVKSDYNGGLVMVHIGDIDICSDEILQGYVEWVCAELGHLTYSQGDFK